MFFCFLPSEGMSNEPENTTGDVGEEPEDFSNILLVEDLGAGTKQQDPLNTLYKHHPEAVLDYKETVIQKLPLKAVPPFTESQLDAHHKSQPFLTQYEKTRILGFRTNQLAQGARPLIPVPEYIKNTLDIARIELEQKRLPFIVKRPMPDGSFEYWRLSDLLVL